MGSASSTDYNRRWSRDDTEYTDYDPEDYERRQEYDRRHGDGRETTGVSLGHQIAARARHMNVNKKLNQFQKPTPKLYDVVRQVQQQRKEELKLKRLPTRLENMIVNMKKKRPQVRKVPLKTDTYRRVVEMDRQQKEEFRMKTAEHRMRIIQSRIESRPYPDGDSSRLVSLPEVPEEEEDMYMTSHGYANGHVTYNDNYARAETIYEPSGKVTRGTDPVVQNGPAAFSGHTNRNANNMWRAALVSPRKNVDRAHAHSPLHHPGYGNVIHSSPVTSRGSSPIRSHQEHEHGVKGHAYNAVVSPRKTVDRTHAHNPLHHPGYGYVMHSSPEASRGSSPIRGYPAHAHEVNGHPIRPTYEHAPTVDTQYDGIGSESRGPSTSYSHHINGKETRARQRWARMKPIGETNKDRIKRNVYETGASNYLARREDELRNAKVADTNTEIGSVSGDSSVSNNVQHVNPGNSKYEPSAVLYSKTRGRRGNTTSRGGPIITPRGGDSPRRADMTSRTADRNYQSLFHGGKASSDDDFGHNVSVSTIPKGTARTGTAGTA